MSAPTKADSSPSNAGEWSKIISAAGEGAGSGMKSAAEYANTKREAKEAKRRTLANLLSSSRKRNQGLFRIGQEHSDEMSEFQANALQDIARGFVESLKGSTQ